MGQETRKDPRAKVLTMTVRYKSATLDEFIEHHSHDVSRGGMFIKTPSPFPPGTLLKFEVKIADDQKVIQGVGRVVWKREALPNDKEQPGGMGVKFIKIDDPSRKTIDQLVDSRVDAGSAYESGVAEGAAVKTAPSTTPLAAMTPAAPEAGSAKPAMPMRKSTMIGLGAMGATGAAAAAAAKKAEASKAAAPAGGGFFPASDSEADMPPPEDRTVMKQAAELLQDALREAGGSMDEVGMKSDARKALPTESEMTDRPASSRKPAQESTPETPAEKQSSGPNTLRSEPPKGDKLSPGSVKPSAASVRPSAASGGSERVRAARPASQRPSGRPPILSEAPPAADSGSGRILVILAGIAVAAGAVFFLTKAEPAPVSEPPSVAAEAKPPEPEIPPAAEAPKPVEPVEPAASAAPAEAASAAPAPSAAPIASAVPAKPALVAPPKPAPAFVAPKPKPKPKPVQPAEPTEGTPPAEAKPDAPASDPAPAPAPKPQPVAPAGDNPY